VSRSPSDCFEDLKNHLQKSFPAYYRLYNVLQQCKTPPSPEELKVAQGKKVLDAAMGKKYLDELEELTNNICDMFEKQAAAAEVRSMFTRAVFHPYFALSNLGTKTILRGS
jgi:hypothetical protein